MLSCLLIINQLTYMYILCTLENPIFFVNLKQKKRDKSGKPDAQVIQMFKINWSLMMMVMVVIMVMMMMMITIKQVRSKLKHIIRNKKTIGKNDCCCSFLFNYLTIFNSSLLSDHSYQFNLFDSTFISLYHFVLNLNSIAT